MNRIFRRLPLPVKLLLIGIIPLILLIYTTYQIYTEKTQKMSLLSNYIERIHQSAHIDTLIDCLENERKLSFDHAMQIDQRDDLALKRPLTDTAIRHLEEGTLSGFRNYTFLNDLDKVRGYVDSGYLSPDRVMHYYTTAIYRINTLNTVSPGSEIYLKPIYNDLVGQKLLSEMITNLGIMRSNIYNVLYIKKYMLETLAGMAGVHDVYKSYETEFLSKASTPAAESYRKIATSSALRPMTAYLDTLFSGIKPVTSYTAADWWKLSSDGMAQLVRLRHGLWGNVIAGTDAILIHEKEIRRRTLVFLVIALLFVMGIVTYIILNITRSLVEMKLAAQRISEGAGGPSLRIRSNDVIGSLARSIGKIDDMNKRMAVAADAIGKGNFDVTVEPRGKEDILGNAIMRMKDNLLQNIRVIGESNHQLQLSAEKYQTIFYKSPLPKWIYDLETLQFLEVNEAAMQHYGYSRAEFLAMTLNDIRPPEDRDKLKSHISDMKAGFGNNEKYWQHIKKNGEKITVEVTAHFIDYSERKARIAVIMDITEKLNAERELAASEERFRSIIEQFPYPVTSYSPEGTCIAANAAWEMMWQDKRENIKGYNIRKDPQLIASGLSRYVEEAFGGELAISEPYHYDPGIVGQKGRKRWMIMTLYPLKNDAGELREVVLILQDISRRKEAEEKLQRSHEELRQLASHLQDIREEERANMAREVHDELGQQITCIKMDVLWLLKKINSADAGEQEKLKAIPELLDHTSRTVRKIATELRPSILDDFGLIEALEWQSSEFEKRSGTKIKFNSTVPHIEIGRSVSTALFRIYQESLTNVARHAAATEVMVNIALKEGRLVLTITDNGRGFDITRIRDGKTLGLLGMKERTLMVGGEYEISSLPGKGTTVTVIAPLQSNHDNNA